MAKTVLDTLSELHEEYKDDLNKFYRQMAELFGIEPGDINPVSAHCEVVLEKPMEEICKDFREMRRWVLCRAWQIVDEEKKPFSVAVKEAWREVKKECGVT